MKKYKSVRKGFLTIVLLCILLCSNTAVAFAHEIYYDGTVGVPLRWNDVTNRTANLKMCGDLLDSNYSSYYSVIRDAWPNASARVSVTETDIESSNVDLATALSSYWVDRWGESCSQIIMGICDAASTDGYALDSLENAKASSGLIRYAGILFSPFTSNYADTTQMKKTMVHEIGHALGLGHPNTDHYVTDEASVMRQDSFEIYYTPQTHDINDLNNMY